MIPPIQEIDYNTVYEHIPDQYKQIYFETMVNSVFAVLKNNYKDLYNKKDLAYIQNLGVDGVSEDLESELEHTVKDLNTVMRMTVDIINYEDAITCCECKGIIGRAYADAAGLYDYSRRSRFNLRRTMHKFKEPTMLDIKYHIAKLVLHLPDFTHENFNYKEKIEIRRIEYSDEQYDEYDYPVGE